MSRIPSVPPPAPPLPPSIRVQSDFEYRPSPPHLEEPLLAPRPHKVTPDLPAEMARTLDRQLSRGLSIPAPADPYSSGPSPSHPSHLPNLTPGFIVPTLSTSPAPLPPPAGSSWSAWNVPRSSSPSVQTNLPHSHPTHRPPFHQSEQSHHSPTTQPRPFSIPSSSDPLSSSMAGLTFSDTPRRKSPESNNAPSLTAPLPTISSLIAALPSIQTPGNSPASKVTWCRDVIALVDRLYVTPNQTDSADPPPGPIHVADQELNDLVEIAIPMILQFANPNPVPQVLPAHIAEALYLRAIFEATGAYPQFVQQNPRMAFRDFERAARAGFSASWFKLGRDYENFGDFPHAKDCYERGIRNNNESCLYRMGMANLMGQLGLPSNPEAALPLLQRAAVLATVEVPQSAYVFGLLLLGEFSPASISPHLFAPLVPPGSARDHEARRHLERAAYLNFAPAQYKLGHAYEFAQPPFPFDPLLSVQYYSLASQQGDIEADMALSKWFLCGSEGAFDKDESLAFTFAEKAARKGLPSAEFAMGYYTEVGVGGPRDIEAARKWYTRASEHGNADATERVAALSQPAPASLSRQEHDNLTETTLVRKRTQAKQRSDARGPAAGPRHGGRPNGQQVVANIRKNSLVHRPGPNRGYPPSSIPAPGPPDYPPDNYAAARPRAPSMPGGGPQPPFHPGPGPSGYTPPSRHQPLPQSVPPQGNINPGGYPSPRIPPQQPFAQMSRPPSLPQLGGPGQPGQPGQPGRRPIRGGSESSASSQQGPLRASSPTGVSDPPVRPAMKARTFEEMGYHSQQLPDKDCVIM